MKSIAILFILMMPFLSEARIPVKVGAYDYPPFVEWTLSRPKGLLVEFLQTMNKVQNKYTFSIVETSPNRRYQDMEKNYFDVIFFEDIQWGWNKTRVKSTQVFYTDGEVLIARKKEGRTQQYFEKLTNKKIRAILGYHYAFFNYSREPENLKKWNLELTNSQDGNLQAVLDDRAEMAIITTEYLLYLFQVTPELKNQTLIFSEYADTYKLRAVIKANARINVDELNDYIVKVKADHKFRSLLYRSHAKL